MTVVYTKVIAPILLFLFLGSPYAGNLGHRMGGDVYKPENTLYCYQLALKNLQHDSKFHYVELDVQETFDGKLVVFHDTNTIKRIVPKSKRNLAILRPVLKTKKFSKIRIRDLKLKQIQKLVLANDARIPTLKMVLDASVKWKLRKPMLIEVKSIRTDACRTNLIDVVAPYRKKIHVNFLAFPNAFRSSFPDSYRWKISFKKHGFKVYTALREKSDKFDLTKDASLTDANLTFKTILPESKFLLGKNGIRTARFPMSVPRLKGKLKLRVGIEHGYDDSMDRGVHYRVLDDKDKVLKKGFSSSRGWVWIEIPTEPMAKLTLVIDDQDTKSKGKHAGNGGNVKASVSFLQDRPN